MNNYDLGNNFGKLIVTEYDSKKPQKTFNNLYVKNFPLEFDDKDLEVKNKSSLYLYRKFLASMER